MSAYIMGTPAAGYAWIYADDTTGLRSRAAQAGAAKRAYERAHGVRLTLISVSYDEMHGFLARSAFRYRVS